MIKSLFVAIPLLTTRGQRHQQEGPRVGPWHLQWSEVVSQDVPDQQIQMPQRGQKRSSVQELQESSAWKLSESPLTCLSPRFLPNGGWIRRFCWPGSLCTLATLFQPARETHTHTHTHTENTHRCVTRETTRRSSPAVIEPSTPPLLYSFTDCTTHTICYKTPGDSAGKQTNKQTKGKTKIKKNKQKVLL